MAKAKAWEVTVKTPCEFGVVDPPYLGERSEQCKVFASISSKVSEWVSPFDPQIRRTLVLGVCGFVVRGWRGG